MTEPDTKSHSVKTEKKVLANFSIALKRIGAYVSAAVLDFRRSPLTMFFTVAYPIILILLFGAIFSDTNASFTSYELYIQSEGDEGFLVQPTPPVFLNFTNTLITTISEIQTNDSQPLFDVKYIPLKDEQNKAIDPGTYLEEVEGYICLLIPENFTQKVLFNYPVDLRIILDRNSQSASISLSIINSIVYNFNLAVNNSQTNLGMETFDIYLEEEIEYFEFLIPGIIGIAIMNNAVLGTINRYSYFKKFGFFRKLSTTPMKKKDIVLGETAWQLIQGIISIIAIIFIAWLAFKLPQGDFGWIVRVLDWKIIPVAIAGVMCFTGLGMIGARIVNNPDAGTAVGNFISFPMMFLSGAFFDVSGVPVINVISKMLPLTYMVDALRASMITNNVAIAWLNIGISLAFGVGLLMIGILLTKLSER
ncbi:MAG: ABC transporter permease [Asgard group archaeon]|nr:ABC transporter permease [Asgard group archaeon]